MSVFPAMALAACCLAPLAAQPPAAADPVAVFTEHPRLFLRPQRLRLLKRERERQSPRWLQLEALVTGRTALPEPGFSQALYYQVSGDADMGRRAVAWALGPATDLRQMALVFDWCQDVLSEAQKHDLAARISKAMAAMAADQGVPAASSRALAAVALYDDVPDAPPRELERIVRQWWEGGMAPALKNGRRAMARDDAYALYEMLHGIRDNTNLDLRDACPQFFAGLPESRLMSYYPAAYPGPENEFHIGAGRISGEPDLRLAALSRAADLAMVNYDTNAPDSQWLQGWLMHDNFTMQGAFGAPYEFLWANPYQPGLSFYHLPLAYHDALLGELFVRSSWDDSAAWFGYFGGVAQRFENGRLTAVDPGASPPVRMDPAVVYMGPGARKFRTAVTEGQKVFLAGLEPRRSYQVEIDDEEMYEAVTDPGGILELDLPHNGEVGVRLR
ncbi:MAG: hypothetical protein ABSF25_13630 [Bryobacteraceae bacterium]|jgi:hypothetical protein